MAWFLCTDASKAVVGSRWGQSMDKCTWSS